MHFFRVAHRRVIVIAFNVTLGIVSALLSPEVHSRSGHEILQQIEVSPDGHFLMQANGKPFFWLSDSPWEIIARATREDADQYLRDRAQKGYTIIFMGALPYFAKDKAVPNTFTNVENTYGVRPLVNDDFNHPNSDYFSYLDWIIDRAAQYKLRVALVPVWGLLSATTGQLTIENAKSYGKWIGHRYRGKGIIWVLGGDLTPVFRRVNPKTTDFEGSTVVDFRPVMDSLASGILEGDGGHALITYHPSCCSWAGTAPPRTSLYLSDRPWLSLNYVQETSFRDVASTKKATGFDQVWKEGFEYEPIQAEYASTPTRPVVYADPNWDNFPIDAAFELNPGKRGRFGAIELRFYAYESVFSGAAGCGYVNASVAQFFSPASKAAPLYDPTGTWREELNAPGANQVALVKSLMLSRPYFTRIPDQSVIVGHAGEGHAHVVATRDRGGSYIMVYLPFGQAVTIEMDRLSAPTATGWWFDPRTGQATRIKETYSTNHPQEFTPPTTGPGNDWVLVLDSEAKHFAAPGTADHDP